MIQPYRPVGDVGHIELTFNPMLFFNAEFPKSSGSRLVFIVVLPSGDNNYVCMHSLIKQLSKVSFPV